ncbi:MAG TPA: M20/M25/M40 family metallo-hydrolase [Vicinamibacterales bacterium]|nr:M20/M25/M40 family metallo-hydrolase [Vicinamibacterales bacterium]
MPTRTFYGGVVAASLAAALAVTLTAQTDVDWTQANAATLEHFSALVQIDTSAKERPAAEYIKKVLDDHGIPASIYADEPDRPNVVARLKGSGKKRPLLLMGHTDTVTIDPSKWKPFGAFSAARDGGYIYGRGTIDDKDNLTASLMMLLLLKQYRVPLDRDVIFLAEAGEEGNSRIGIQYMIAQHYDDIDAEYCLAEAGDGIRQNGAVRYVEVETSEKFGSGVELVAHGISGHGSIPLKSNAIVHLATAVGKIGEWRPDIKLNETTATYFRRLSQIAATPEQKKVYADVLSTDPKVQKAADDWLFEHEPRNSSKLRTSVSPNIFQGGYRSNVIPSEAKATLDVRMVPDEDRAKFLEQLKQIVNDPAVDVHYTANAPTRPHAAPARLDSELYKTVESAVAKVYNVPAVPNMQTGATDKSPLRAKGQECLGIGSAIDVEDQLKGYGMHSDQERIREDELYRFVRFNWEIVNALARAR